MVHRKHFLLASLVCLEQGLPKALTSMAYYIAPRFLEKLSVHITKNYLKLPGVRVPLILGVHGRKGEGKTFMCELVYEHMGVEAIHVSAGELESPDAGDPARLIRLRYREAAELVKVRGKMAVLMINDIDAGIGRVDAQTQYTVNTQLVNATLMNIADNPTNVQLPGSYDAEPVQRIPMILTGNDLATLYAPLVRDGRMEKFYWEPDAADLLGVVLGIFAPDSVPESEVVKLVEAFPQQSIDFFSALRSRLYDEQVRQLIQEIGIEQVSKVVVHTDGKPGDFHQPNFRLEHLLELGQQMVREQERIRELRLVEEYHSAFRSPTPSGVATPSPATPSAASAPPLTAPRPAPKDVPAAPMMDGEAVIPEVARQEIYQLFKAGYRLGVEWVDARRFRIGSWQCYGTYDRGPDEAIAALAECLRTYPQHYVRIVGIGGDRHRLSETIIQRPGSAVSP